MDGDPCRVQWPCVDLEDRRSVGRPARPVSVVSNVPPPVSAVGPLGRAAIVRGSRSPSNVESATPHEVKLVHATLAERFVRQLPDRLIGDNAYESDRLDAELARRGAELIAPHRRTL